ncbi:hypothetical protein PHMEG_0007990, partial [Phytophthora megakarya]
KIVTCDESDAATVFVEGIHSTLDSSNEPPCKHHVSNEMKQFVDAKLSKDSTIFPFFHVFVKMLRVVFFERLECRCKEIFDKDTELRDTLYPRELYVGLGSGFLEWGRRFERQVNIAQSACGFPWPEDVKLPTLQYVMEKMLETFKTTITPTQAMKLFTATKDPKRSWPEHYMYLVAISEACGNSADYLVLDNIVQYASADLRTVLTAKVDGSRTDYLLHAEDLAQFAQSWEIETGKGKNFGCDVVSSVRERRQETRRCHKCGEVGHLRAACPARNNPDIVLAVNETLDASDDIWILDNGSSRHLVNDASYLDDVEECDDQCVQPNGEPLAISMKGSVTLRVAACGVEQVVRLSNVYFAKNVVHNLISYGQLDKVGYPLAHRAERRSKPLSEVNMAVLNEEVNGSDEVSSNVQEGTLVEFHRRLGHLNYNAVERLARDTSSGIRLTDHKRANCLICAQGKQAKNKQSGKDTGDHSPIHRMGGVIWSDLKGPMTPRDRLNNRYMFEHFLTFFEKRFDCRSHVVRTDSGGEYQNVDLFCKKTDVTRQRSEANNQASNGKAEHMHRTIMNMVRCTIFASPTNANPGRVSPLKMLEKKTPSLGGIVVFGYPCTVYGDPRNKNFSQRAQQEMIVGIVEETKGYRVYLPKDRVVITTQHVKNIETLNKEQNVQVQKLYLQDEDAENVDESADKAEDAAVAASADGAAERRKKPKKRGKKKAWQRERHMTRSVAHKTAEEADASAQQEEATGRIVNNVTDVDPRNYGEAMRSRHPEQ